MRIQFIDVEVKPLPLRFLVIWIKYGICVIFPFYQAKAMASLNTVKIHSGSVVHRTYKVVSPRISSGLILLEISCDRTVLKIGRFGIWGLSHHDKEGYNDRYHE
jgi:hypothetical protein